MLRHKHRTACASDSHPASWTGTWRPCPCPSCLWTKRPALAQIGCADGACDHAQSALQAFPFRPESHLMVNKLTQPLQQPLPRPLGPIRSTARLAHQSTRGPAKSPGVPLLSVFREPVMGEAAQLKPAPFHPSSDFQKFLATFGSSPKIHLSS